MNYLLLLLSHENLKAGPTHVIVVSKFPLIDQTKLEKLFQGFHFNANI